MPEQTTTAAGLHTAQLTVRYGGVVANCGISLDVPPGKVVGLIGPNGAGKTTFVDAVTGFTTCAGEVWLDGTRIDRLSPHRRRRIGLTRTWQAGELFGNLTVAENILVAARPGGLRALWRDVFGRADATGRSVAEQVLATVGLAGVADRLARDLTLGQQKLVGVARALVGNCQVLLLDEPAAGLDSHESVEFADRVREVAAHGPGILLIDHDISLVLNVCDIVYVLEFGKLIFAGRPEAARVDPAVVAAYLGVPMEAADA